MKVATAESWDDQENDTPLLPTPHPGPSASSCEATHDGPTPRQDASSALPPSSQSQASPSSQGQAQHRAKRHRSLRPWRHRKARRQSRTRPWRHRQARCRSRTRPWRHRIARHHSFSRSPRRHRIARHHTRTTRVPRPWRHRRARRAMIHHKRRLGYHKRLAIMQLSSSIAHLENLIAGLLHQQR